VIGHILQSVSSPFAFCDRLAKANVIPLDWIEPLASEFDLHVFYLSIYDLICIRIYRSTAYSMSR